MAIRVLISVSFVVSAILTSDSRGFVPISATPFREMVTQGGGIVAEAEKKGDCDTIWLHKPLPCSMPAAFAPSLCLLGWEDQLCSCTSKGGPGRSRSTVARPG